MSCDAVMAALGPIDCQMTEQGARVVTQCLHPSFDPVVVYVQRHVDDRFLVHDGGEAYDIAWANGRNPSSLTRHLEEHALRFGVDFEEPRLSVRALSAAWLPNCIMAVSNAAAAATNALLAAEAEDLTADNDFRERVVAQLNEAFSPAQIMRKVQRKSRHGKTYRFDFAVRLGADIALVDTVTPHPNSVAAKFTAFSAVNARSLGGAFAVHDHRLAEEDVALLSEVADVVPFAGLVASIEREASARSRLQ